jgi:hypothetical protein
VKRKDEESRHTGPRRSESDPSNILSMHDPNEQNLYLSDGSKEYIEVEVERYGTARNHFIRYEVSNLKADHGRKSALSTQTSRKKHATSRIGFEVDQHAKEEL